LLLDRINIYFFIIIGVNKKDFALPKFALAPSKKFPAAYVPGLICIKIISLFIV